MRNGSTMAKWVIGLVFVAISAYAADEIPPPPGGDAAPAPAAEATPATPDLPPAPPSTAEGAAPAPAVVEGAAAGTVDLTAPPAVDTAVVPNEAEGAVVPPPQAPPANPAVVPPPAAITEVDLTPPPSHARGNRDPIRQLGRGVANVLTGVCEIPFNIYNVNEEDGDIAAVTYGLFRGVWRCCVREVVGVGEIITFPFGWKSVVDPEFFFDPAPTTDWRLHRPGRLVED